ncbi:hypothetical protein O3M35_000974 [Rhynocoris fuscipes]|uniref:Uncharacterized protein n=1 Tax=Rhynocoris fuscipes TaxID=488301 RepID=A0AAW1DNK7_9HEMI
MILIKSGLVLVLCVLARGHDKRELGFTGLGSYHGGNDGHSSSLYSAVGSQQNNIDRQGNVAVPEYTGGLTNFASNGNPINTHDSTGNAANQINVNPHNNPIIVPNLGLQYGANHVMQHNTAYAPLNHGLNFGQSSFSGPMPNPIIPVHDQPLSNGHLLTPMRHIQFPALAPTVMQDYRNPSFLPPVTTSGISLKHDPTFGQNFLPTVNNQGFYGQGNAISPISHGQYDFGGFQPNQPTFGHYAPSVPIVQGISHPTVGHNIPAFHGHGVNNLPIIPFPVNPPVLGHANTFPVGDAGGENIPNDHFSNTDGNTASAPEINQDNPTHDAGDAPNDSYSPQSAHTDESAYEGNVNSADDTPNQHSSDINSDYQDNYNEHNNDDSKGNSYDPSYPISSQEVSGDSVGSYVGSDSSQIGQGTSVEQKYGSTSERSSSQTHNQPTSKVNSAKSRNGKSSSLVTNGHAVGHDENGQKATSFQSFVIHSYKPKRFFPKKNSPNSFEGVFGKSDTYIDIPVEHHKH